MMFEKIRKKLDGIKVYLIAAGGIITLLVQFGNDAISAGELLNGIILALGAIAGRAAIKKSGTLA